ncbi:MAG: hypothetical protein HMLKMBBP_01967 [Planctomycetes bacterium]|nr:hypothetical protein [Planctomycetota bacterium]
MSAPHARSHGEPHAGAPYRLPPLLAKGLRLGAAAGILGFCAGTLLAPDRAWTGLLAGFHAVLGLALAGGVFLSLLACSGARWAAALRRVPEAMSAALPVAAIAGIVLLFGAPMLFPWSRAEAAHDPHLAAKQAYLNVPFLAARTVAAFALWWWLGSKVRSAAPGAPRLRWGAAFMAVFAVTYSWTSVDWLKSLEPAWFSTIFSLTSLAGLALSGTAACVLLGSHLRRSGAWRGVFSADHVHDLAKLLFAFSMFWSYIHYSQYMLIWYTNMPEETVWYAARSHGMWWATGALSFALNGLVPFVVLLFRGMRRNERVVARVAGLVLVGRIADLFFHVGPPLLGPEPWPSAWEVLPIVGLGCLFTLVVLRRIEAAPTVNPAEPGFADSLHHHVA